MNNMTIIDLIDGAVNAQMHEGEFTQTGDPKMDAAPRLSHVGLYVHDTP
jgi:hypothetical protein